MKTLSKSAKKSGSSVVSKPKTVGRPTEYSDDRANALCAVIASGVSLRKACKMPGQPSIRTVYNWFAIMPLFVQQYARAKEDSADALAEDIQQIADDVLHGKIDPKVGKVAGELKQWSASKLKPKKYGERLDLTSGGEALPTPSIYLPKELSYRQVQDVQEAEVMPGLPG